MIEYSDIVKRGLARKKDIPEPEFYFDPASKADGALDIPGTTNWSGTTGPALLRFASGRIVHTPYSGGGNSAGYVQKQLAGTVQRIGAQVAWPASAVGSVTLVLPMTAWSQGVVTNAAVHWTVGGNGLWNLSFIIGSPFSSTIIADNTTHGRFYPVWDGRLRPIEIFLDSFNSRVRLKFPDEYAVNVSLIYAATDHTPDVSNLAIWELFENNGVTDTPAQIGAIWADSKVARPGRATVLHRDLSRLYQSPPAQFNVSGTMILRTAGNVYWPTLVGNVTTWYFDTEMPDSTRDAEIHFIQDATGSRTLSGHLSSIKLAGTLTLTTTAGKRDIVRLRYVHGAWYEVSRSMNVG